MAKQTYEQLIERVAMTALEQFKAMNAYKSLKLELSAMYDTFFAAHGRPEGKFDQYNDDFLPVMNFTDTQFSRVQQAKKTEYNARRRLITAVRALAECRPATLKEAA